MQIAAHPGHDGDEFKDLRWWQWCQCPVTQTTHRSFNQGTNKNSCKIPIPNPASSVALTTLNPNDIPLLSLSSLSIFGLVGWWEEPIDGFLFFYLISFFRVKLCNWHVQEAQLISEKRILELRVAELRLVWFDFYYQASSSLFTAYINHTSRLFFNIFFRWFHNLLLLNLSQVSYYDLITISVGFVNDRHMIRCNKHL